MMQYKYYGKVVLNYCIKVFYYNYDVKIENRGKNIILAVFF